VLLVNAYVEAVALLLILAGASKLRAFARRVDVTDSAPRRALRLTVHQWPVVEALTGALEVLASLLVLTALAPLLGAGVMAACGVLFLLTLGYVHVRGISGDCGCVRMNSSDTSISGAFLRAGGVVLGGVAGVILYSRGGEPSLAEELALAPVALALALVAVGAGRGPCGYGLVPGRQVRARLRVHPAFRTIAEARSLHPEPLHQQRRGCDYEFWFADSARVGYVDTIVHVARGEAGTLVVHAEVQTPWRNLSPSD
jgi:hypothetical protein